MLLQSSPLFNSVVEWNLRVVVCHSFAVKRPDRTSALAQVKKTAARVLCIFTDGRVWAPGGAINFRTFLVRGLDLSSCWMSFNVFRFPVSFFVWDCQDTVCC